MVAVVVLTVFAPATATAVPSPPHQVFGTVEDQNGNAVSDVTVTVSGPDGSSYSATTNADGYYDIDVPASEHDTGDELTISAEGSSETTSFSSGASEEFDISVQVETDDTPTPDDPDGDDTGPSGSTGGGSGSADDADDSDAGQGTTTTSGVSGTDSTVTVNGQSLTGVGFTSQTDLDATVSVTERTAPSVAGPEGTTFVTGADITFNFGSSDGVETVRFTLQQSQLDDLGVSASQLTIYHLDESSGEWEELETTVVSEDGTSVVVEAPSAGFSEYAVFTQDADETGTPVGTPADTSTPVETADDGDTADTTEPAPTATGGSGPGFTAVLALVALLIGTAAARIAN